MNRKEYQRQYREKNKRQLAEKKKAYYEANKDSIKQKRIDKPEVRKKYHLSTTYGISLDDYNRMLSEQSGVCGICSNPPKDKDLAVDHCHTTGKVRGLLCSSCNLAVGNIKESVKSAESLVNYLKTHKYPN